MSLDNFTEKVKLLVSEDSGINYKVKFHFPEGIVFVDATCTPNLVSNEDQDADTTISMSLDDADKFLDGNLNPMTAFMMGKMRVEGSMGVALKVADFVKGKSKN